jgi:PKHD-type hydroxylase
VLLNIPDVLAAETVREFRELLEGADWVDGTSTAGFQSAVVKHNRQLPTDSAIARKLGERVLDAIGKSMLFNSAALPARVFPPLFNCYAEGQSFGNHVDNAIRQDPKSGFRVRTDISATLYLSSPDEYDGGELIIDDTYGAHKVKLPAGHMVLYPGTSLHRVMPVTRGKRYASFFWVQSLVREDSQRSLLFDMDMAILRLRKKACDSEEVVALISVYHNLLRRWASL